MPAYAWLEKNKLDFSILPKKLSVMRMIGVPYTQSQIEDAEASARADAKLIAERLANDGAPSSLQEKEIIALIAYLQALGQMKNPALVNKR
jgi:cytochrome c oxidase cbb3-type subunit I/II